MFQQDAHQTITISDAIKRYCETARKGGATKTLEVYYFEVLARHFEKMGLGDLNQIRLFHLEQLQTKLLDEVRIQYFQSGKTNILKGRKASTVNRMFTSYKAFLNKCVHWDLLQQNPAQRLKKLPEEPTLRPLWAADEFKRFMTHLPTWAADVLYFLAETGARPGEAARLKHGDVDYTTGTVVCTSYKGQGQAIQRHLPMSPALADFLRLRCYASNKSEFIFLNSKGKPVTSCALGIVIRKTRKHLGLKDITAYGLRHTYISALVEMGVHLLKIKALAGHRKIETTEKYVRLKQEQLRDVVNKCAEFRKLCR